MQRGEIAASAMAELEKALRELPPYDFKANTKHYFAHGTYVRELFIPAGVIITGKIHKNSCINIIATGKIRLIADEGLGEVSEPVEISGYATVVTERGVKKAVLALEDTIFLNVLPWAGEEDPERAEAMLTYDSYDAMERDTCLLV